jgi:hypothetical protein
MSRTTVFLTGGLGNQLFQYAAGLSRNSDELFLDCDLGAPRRNVLGTPDIFDFELVETLEKSPSRLPKSLFSKTAGFMLRQGIYKKWFEQFRLSRSIINFTGNVILSTWLLSPTRIIKATDNGFCQMPNKSKREYLIGYFQSYIWPSDPSVEPKLRLLCLKSPSKEFMNFIETNQGNGNVVVHVRLGDYKNEDGFGIPSKKYYEMALERLNSLKNISSIWLFSNEPKEALNFIPNEYLDRVVVVPEFSGSAAETLEAMRRGDRYVIGNSSLSWWGAFLSYSKNRQVIAPEPWFKINAEPSKIVPPNWIRLEAWPQD